jgi:hypothetical protein
METLNGFFKEIMADDIKLNPMANLIEGETYLYKANDSPFDKSFYFTIKEDRFDSYLISIMGETDYEMPKDFELLEAVNNGVIVPHRVKK